MTKMIRLVLYVIFLVGTLMISGCWDSKEVEDLAVTTLIAWDRVTVNGEDLWQISTRIMDLTGITGSEGKGNATTQEILVKGTGATVQDAFTELEKRLPAKTFYQHNVASIVGERVAREELTYMLNSTLWFQQSRIRVDIFVCQGEAFKILQTKPELSSTLSKEVRKISDKTTEKTGSSLKVTVLEFSKEMIRKDRDSVLPVIKIYKKKEGEETAESSIEIGGFGVIRDSKLVGWLNGDEALGYILSVGNPRKPEIPLDVKYKDIQLSYYMNNTKGKISSELVNGKPKFSIRIKTEGAVHEASVPMLNPEEQPAIEKAIEERLLEVVWQAVNKAREYDADIFGFNENLHRYHLRNWEKIEPNWRKRFQEAEIEVEAEAKITGFGTTNQGFDF